MFVQIASFASGGIMWPGFLEDNLAKLRVNFHEVLIRVATFGVTDGTRTRNILNHNQGLYR
jgi:hypothetical protein